MKTKKERLHKRGCYSMYYDDKGRCIKCGVLFKDKAKITKKQLNLRSRSENDNNL